MTWPLKGTSPAWFHLKPCQRCYFARLCVQGKAVLSSSRPSYLNASWPPNLSWGLPALTTVELGSSMIESFSCHVYVAMLWLWLKSCDRLLLFHSRLISFWIRLRVISNECKDFTVNRCTTAIVLSLNVHVNSSRVSNIENRRGVTFVVIMIQRGDNLINCKIPLQKPTKIG